MSWSVSFVAQDVDKAIAAVSEATETAEHRYGIPSVVAAAIVDRLSGVKLAPGTAVAVETSGHFDAVGQSSATFKVASVMLK